MDGEDAHSVRHVVDSNIIPDLLVFLTKILEKNNKSCINECVYLFSILSFTFTIYPLDPNNLIRYSNTGIIENTHKILTEYESSIYFFRILTFLYDRQFRNIVRACTKLDQFESLKLLEKAIESTLYTNDLKKMMGLVTFLIENRPTHEESARNQIIKLSK